MICVLFPEEGHPPLAEFYSCASTENSTGSARRPRGCQDGQRFGHARKNVQYVVVIVIVPDFGVERIESIESEICLHRGADRGGAIEELEFTGRSAVPHGRPDHENESRPTTASQVVGGGHSTGNPPANGGNQWEHRRRRNLDPRHTGRPLECIE